MKQNTELLGLLTNIERDLDAYITIGGVRYGANDTLQKFKLNNKIHLEGNWIGQAIPKQLDVTLILDEYTFSLGDEVVLFHGVKKPNNEIIYQNLGRYYINSIEKKEDSKTVSLICYDVLKTLQGIRSPNIQYPITINNLLNALEILSGLVIDRNNLLFSSFEIPEEIYFGKNASVIDVLRMIAGANLCYVTLDNDNVIQFKRPSSSGFEISTENVFKLKAKDQQPAYNTVVISRMPQNDNVFVSNTQDNQIELKLANNTILDLNREYFAQELLSVAEQIQYDGIQQLIMQSNTLIEVGDYVQVLNYNFLVLEHTLTLTRSELFCPISKKSETDFKKAKGLEEALIETELYVDKVKHEIVAKIGDEVGDKLVELGLTQEGITQIVKDNTEEKITEIQQSIHNLSVTVQTGGGLNLIKNSVGYAGLDFWELYSTRKDARTGVSTWILQGVSKHGFILNNAYVTQKISVLEGRTYTLSGKVKKATASGYIRIGVANVGNGFVGNEASTYDDEFKYTFTSPSNEIELILNCTSTGVEITDLSLIEGDNQSVWTQASGEIYNVNVLVDTQGIKVYNTQKTAYTIMSPSEFAHYYGNQKVFTINGDIAELEGLLIKNKGLFMPPIKFVQNKTRNSVAIVYMGG